MSSDLLQHAITLLGSQGRLAKATGYTQHGIWWALNHGNVSPELAAMVELASGGEIRREEICTESWVFAGLLRPNDLREVLEALRLARPETIRAE